MAILLLPSLLSTASAISLILSDPAEIPEKSNLDNFRNSDIALLRPGLFPAFPKAFTPSAIAFSLEIPSPLILAIPSLISANFSREFLSLVKPRCPPVTEDSISICKLSMVLSIIYLLSGSNCKLSISFYRP